MIFCDIVFNTGRAGRKRSSTPGRNRTTEWYQPMMMVSYCFSPSSLLLTQSCPNLSHHNIFACLFADAIKRSINIYSCGTSEREVPDFRFLIQIYWDCSIGGDSGGTVDLTKARLIFISKNVIISILQW